MSPFPRFQGRANFDPECYLWSLVAGGQVSHVDPDSMGLNPAWRNGLVLVYISRTWREGANLAEIEAARQLLIEDMRTLEAIAPESGAYFNEV